MTKHHKRCICLSDQGVADEEIVERVAKAIYDAEDPNSGDSIATTIHTTEHIPPHGTIAEQLEQVMDTCRAAAHAAIAAARPLIEAEERERCAQVADECAAISQANYAKEPPGIAAAVFSARSRAASDIAAAIRSGSAR